MKTHVLTAIWALLATATVAQSRRWFAREVGCWITQEKVPASWEDAQLRCERHGAILASPLNTQLLDYMQSLINVHNHSVAYFIGVRANRSEDGQEVRYESVEGRQLDDMPYAVFAAIEQLDLEQGDCLSMDRRGIRTVSCWDHLPYICYSNDTTECGLAVAPPPSSTALPPSSTAPPPSSTAPPPSSTAPPPSSTAPPPSSTAPPGYTYKPATGSWYKYHKSEVSWDAALAVCTSEGGHLVVLNDAVEAETVRDIMRDGGYGTYQYMWIDLRDNQPGGVTGDWRTVRGQPVSDVYHGWSSNRAATEASWKCAILNENKLLYNWTCDGNTNFVCEMSL